MTIACKELVDVSVTPWYHCITRCVRRAFFLVWLFDRKQWVDDRIEELAEIFSVGVGGFSVMDNDLNLPVDRPEIAKDWSDDEVVRRGRLYPPRDKSRKPLPISEEWVQGRLKDDSPGSGRRLAGQRLSESFTVGSSEVPERRGHFTGSARSRIGVGWTHYPAGHVRGTLDRQLSPFGGLYWAALSRRQSPDIGRAGRHS